jgi:K+-transporting ATPase ATPase C chain
MKFLHSPLRPSLVMLACMTLLTGLAYPLFVTAIAQAAFPHQSNGSLIRLQGQVVGSELIGQPFSSARYFWGRLSATGTFPYNAFNAKDRTGSSGSNEGPMNPALLQAARARIAALRADDPQNTSPIPVDLVTTSASGLDPDISIASVLYQVPRVAGARGLNGEQVRALVLSHIEPRQLGFLGEPRVNVLLLNLALDGIR